MIEKISVQHYQSLGDVEVELGPITVVVGPSNQGKSALIRALQAAAFNQTGNGFITNGETSCAVTLQLEEGHSLMWSKGSAAKYLDMRDGNVTPYSRMGADVPAEVQQGLGLRRLEIDNTKLAPQFAGQFDSPFLLTESASKAARVIARVTRLDILLEASASAKRDLKRAQSRKDTLQEQLDQRIEAKESYAGLERRREQLEAWKARYWELEEAEALGRTAVANLTVIHEISAELARKQLPFADIQHALLSLEAVTDINRHLEDLRKTRHALEAITTTDPSIVEQLLRIFALTIPLPAQLLAVTRLKDSVSEAIAEEQRCMDRMRWVERELSAFPVCPKCGQFIQGGKA